MEEKNAVAENGSAHARFSLLRRLVGWSNHFFGNYKLIELFCGEHL